MNDHDAHPSPPDSTAERYVLRAAHADDLDALERMARASAAGITTLPPDRGALKARLERSAVSFASADQSSGEEVYIFVLEDRLRVGRSSDVLVGTCAITACAGFADRFYAYRNETLVQASAVLQSRNRVHILQLCHALTGTTLLSSFYIEPACEHGVAPQLLSRARLLFIAEFSERFSDHIASESPGLADSDGRCPFWDAVGRCFFDMDYPQAERLAMGRSKAFIADLFPQAPVYVPLLPEEAQWAIGQLNPVAEVPYAILMEEGFESETYIDVFDGGPIVDARLASLRTAAQSRAAPVTWSEDDPNGTFAWHLVSTTRRDGFRAVLARARWQGGQWCMAARDAARLGLQPSTDLGMRLRAAPLAQAGGVLAPAGVDEGDTA